jgi:hypothetical protein
MAAEGRKPPSGCAGCFPVDEQVEDERRRGPRRPGAETALRRIPVPIDLNQPPRRTSSPAA